MKGYGPLDAMQYPRFSGIRTFMRLPYVQDLTGVDFAIIGVPFDTGATYRVGARFGPEGIRSASVLLRPYNQSQEVAVFDRLSGVDYGDFAVVPGYLPESHARITEQMTPVLAAGVTPIVLGGDHSITLPELRAINRRFGAVGLIQFDSHGDVWHGYFGGKDTHGTPFRRAVEEGLLDMRRSSQVGLRGSVYSAADIQASRDLGFQVFTADQVRRAGLDAVIAAVKARAGNGPCFLTFDIDFVDPTFAPATGTPEVGGFNSWESLALVRGLKGINFVAFDLVELSPPYDNPGATTSLLAANLVYEFISLLALGRP
ncbi:MAG: agmatinase [Chloroflexi bacterium]|nr:agmatinase [Chloroflexota bacterium]MCI0645156.1 agmatinase [Chloroflexota bacterium]MCI0725636.1 agmatinase [Chloroflexota bacterium]